MLIQVETFGDYFGKHNETMCRIEDDGVLIALHREMQPLLIVHDQVSSNDAMDIRLYEVDGEEDLVYISETYRTDRIGFSRFAEIELIFNEESVKHVEKVVAKLREEIGGSSIARMDIKVVPTFETKEEELDDWVREALRKEREG